jgi:endonuclease/exonuclease/phosphatase family metal-dependent hydrolase
VAGVTLREQSAASVRVATFNTHHGTAPDGRPALDACLRLLDDLAPDVIALQEVDRGWRRSGFADQPARYAEGCGGRALFAANLRLPAEDDPIRGGAVRGSRGAVREYGTVLLTRHPILRAAHHPLPVPLGAEPRGVQVALIDVRGVPIRFAGVHLHDGDDAVSARQAEEVLRRLAADEAAPGAPEVVLGDLNAEPGRGGHRVLLDAGFADAWAIAGTGPGRTFLDPESGSGARIDHVLVRGAAIASARVGSLVPTPSDHEPLIVEISPRG